MGHFGIGRYQPQGNGFVSALIAQDIPPSVVAPFVFVDERLGCLQWNVVGLKSDVGKKRLVRFGVGFEVLQGFVDVKL